MVPGLMPVRKCHSPQRGWVGHSLTCITALCSRWAFSELWAMKHSPVDVNVHVRKDILCRIKFEKCCTFYSPPWVFSDHRAHGHINGAEKLASKDTGLTLLNPVFPILPWPWSTMFALCLWTSACWSSGWEMQFFLMASLIAARSLQWICKWVFMWPLFCAVTVTSHVQTSKQPSASKETGSEELGHSSGVTRLGKDRAGTGVQINPKASVGPLW